MNETPKNKSGRRIQRTLLIWLAFFAVIVLSIVVFTLANHYEPITNLYWGRIFVTGVVGASVPICLWMFARWSCRSWRNFRRLLIGLAILATLVAALVTEEDWRGKHDWENYKRQLEAKGEKLDWQAFVPPPVPDDQNFFCAPIVAEVLSVETERKHHRFHSTCRSSCQLHEVRHLPWQFRKLAVTGRQLAKGHVNRFGRVANLFPDISTPRRRANQWLSHCCAAAIAGQRCAAGFEQIQSDLGGVAPSQPAAVCHGSRLNYANGLKTSGQPASVFGGRKTMRAIAAIAGLPELQDGQSEGALEDTKFVFAAE